jgi:hypothetical protein
MSCIKILINTPTWLPFVAVDVDDGDPRTGITFNQVDVGYKKSNQASFQTKVLVGGGTDFRENGNGVYEILFSAAELDTLGSFIYVVNSNGALPSPAIRQYLGQALVESATVYTPGSISLSTNILTGNLIDLSGDALVGEAVSARIISAPTVIGTSPNIGGVGTTVVSAQTDEVGFFALEVLQGAVIDVTIPVTNYRRTLTVPANTTDTLFDLP